MESAKNFKKCCLFLYELMRTFKLDFKEENKKDWNEFLLSSKNYHFFQSFQWLNLKKNCKFPDKWKPILLQIKDEEENFFSCGILKWLCPFLPFSILWAPRAPTFSKLNEAIITKFFEKIKEIGKNENSIFFIFSPYIQREENNLFKKAGFDVLKINIPTISMPENVMILSLEENTDEIFNKMEKDTRYMIRRAEREGVRFFESKEIEDLKYFYKILKDSGKRKGFPVRSFSHLKKIWEHLYKDNMTHLFFTKKDDFIYSGAIIINFGKRCWFLYGASVQETPKNLFPSHYLQWQIIKWAKEREFELYDLRGAMGYNHPPSSPAYGVYHFKKGFGAKLVNLSENLGIVFKPKIYNLFFNISSKFLPFIKRIYLKFR